MKEVTLSKIHSQSGAKMIEFGGWYMPVSYTSVIDEHLSVRKTVGVFDVSHMGEFLIRGNRALELIQKVTSNDASKLQPGKAQYSCLPNEKGGIIDDLIVYQLEKDSFFLVVNAANIEKDWNWIKEHNQGKAEMLNQSDEFSLFAVQGPCAVQTLQKLTKFNLTEIEYYSFRSLNFAGIENMLIAATGYTGEPGFEIFVPNMFSEKIWYELMQAGKEFNIQPVGLGARDTLRLEMGYCLYGNDIDDTTSPIEAGLSWITKFDKDFVGKDIIYKHKTEGLNRKLVGISMIDKGIPRAHYEIFNEQQQVIGHVTSGTHSPTLQIPIGMGYVQSNYTSVGSEIFIRIRDKILKAIVCKMPFYKKK